MLIIFATFEYKFNPMIRLIHIIFFFSVLFSGLCANGHPENHGKEIIYVGTFSEGGSLGIYVFDMDRENMRFDLIQTIVTKKSPSFVAASPDGRFLFSANRGGTAEEEGWGSVSSFAIDPASGKLTVINTKPSHGAEPCYVSVHPSGKYIFVTHYLSGNFVVFPINENGEIGEPSTDIMLKGKGTVMPRQARPHPHSAVPSADGKFLYVSDLGQDKILIYNFDNNTGTVTPAAQPFVRTMPGAGPRHLEFNPDGSLAFSSEEISSSICSYKVNKQDGSLQLVERLPAIPTAFVGENSSADVHTALDGKVVYISNRGYDGLGIFKVKSNGRMKNIGYMPAVGRKPRSFMVDPQNHFLLVGNRDSGEINIFTIEKDGKLTDTNAYLSVPSPVSFEYIRLK